MQRFQWPVAAAPAPRAVAGAAWHGLQMEATVRTAEKRSAPRITAATHEEAALMFEAARRHVEDGDAVAMRTRLDQGLAALELLKRSARSEVSEGRDLAHVYDYLLRRLRSADGSPEALELARDIMREVAAGWRD